MVRLGLLVSVAALLCLSAHTSALVMERKPSDLIRPYKRDALQDIVSRWLHSWRSGPGC